MRSIDRGHGPLLQGRVLQERAMRAMNVIADRGQTRTYEAGLGAFDVSGLIARLRTKSGSSSAVSGVAK